MVGKWGKAPAEPLRGSERRSERLVMVREAG